MICGSLPQTTYEWIMVFLLFCVCSFSWGFGYGFGRNGLFDVLKNRFNSEK